MSKAPSKIKSLAREHTETALKVLHGVMTSEQSSDSARVAAANSLLDRGWGKPAQPQTGEDGEGAIEMLHRIERVLIDPNPKA